MDDRRDVIASHRQWSECTDEEKEFVVYGLAYQHMRTLGWEVPPDFLARLTDMADRHHAREMEEGGS